MYISIHLFTFFNLLLGYYNGDTESNNSNYNGDTESNNSNYNGNGNGTTQERGYAQNDPSSLFISAPTSDTNAVNNAATVSAATLAAAALTGSKNTGMSVRGGGRDEE